MRRVGLYMLMGVAFGWGQARADLTIARPSAQAAPAADSAASPELQFDLLLGLHPDAFADQVLPAESSASPAENVQLLPPPPDSASLFVSALLSIGAWQALRNARHMTLGSLPEWYHEGAPAQLGHSRVVDPFHLAVPAAAVLWVSPPRSCAGAIRIGWDISRPHALCFPPVPQRRGPPRAPAASV